LHSSPGTHCNTLQRTATYEFATSHVFGVSTPPNQVLRANTCDTTNSYVAGVALQCVAVCRSVCVDSESRERIGVDLRTSLGTHCNTLQHTATHCNTLQRTASYEFAVSHVFGVSTPSLESKIRATLQIRMLQGALQCVAVRCSVLQCFAVCVSTPSLGSKLRATLQIHVLQCVALQCVALCCSVLQCVAVCVSTPSLESKLARTSRDLCKWNISQRSAALVSQVH